MPRPFAAWDRYWLRPASPAALGLFRFAFFSAVLLVYARLDDRPCAELAALWNPVSFFSHLPDFWRHPAILGVAQVVWKISLAAAAAGFFTRASTGLSALLGIYLLGLPDNFGKIDHQDGIIAVFLCVLCLSSCGDDLGVDAQFRARVPAFSRRSSAKYGWPPRLCRALLVLLFFAAGIAKLRGSHLAWIGAANLRYLLLSHAYANHPPTLLGLLVARSRLLCAIGAVALELAMPLALFSRRLRYPLLLAMLFLQSMIALTMGVYFTPFLPAYLAFLPWDRWAAMLRRAAPPVFARALIG